jgi:hypothetical protein
MKITGVADTEKNIQICKKNCGTCSTYQFNHLGGEPLELLFCSRGATEKNNMNSKMKDVTVHLVQCL